MNAIPGFEPHHRFDFFEPGDKTALVCLDVPEMQRLAVEQLDAVGYKIHTALFLEDCVLKLRAHPYDLVLVSEHFNGLDLSDHVVLREGANTPPAVRRRQVYVLIGPNFVTNDELQAFSHSVDAVVALSDLQNLKPVVRRAAQRQAEFHGPLHETLLRLSTGKLDGQNLGVMA